MTQEALKLALEALDNLMYWDNGKPDYDEAREAITAIKEALAQHDSVQAKPEPEQEPVAPPVIAGALFDFMGWLTSRKERIVLSSADNASPAADAIRDFAKMRGLSLDDAKVQDWNITPPQRTERPVDCERCNRLEEQAYDLVGKLRVANIKLSMQPQRTWVGLVQKDRNELALHWHGRNWTLGDIISAVEAKLKEKNA